MNRFIIADATKCIGCRTCEVACAVSHQENQDCAALSPDEFISRIRVIKDHSWTTAVACHQCEDAPCANVCPVDAISREHGHIFVEQSRCIGCKSCMLACPFGAMEVVSSRKKARAIKCDLCWHRATGPACVEACPTKALQCMDVEKVQRHRLRQHQSPGGPRPHLRVCGRHRGGMSPLRPPRGRGRFSRTHQGAAQAVSRHLYLLRLRMISSAPKQ